MSDRGLKPTTSSSTSGRPATARRTARRPARVCFARIADFDGGLGNAYDRPIEGVVATVDMNRLKVIDVTDTGIRPVDTTITGQRRRAPDRAQAARRDPARRPELPDHGQRRHLAGLALHDRLHRARGPRPPSDRLRRAVPASGRSSIGLPSTTSTCRTRCPTRTGSGGRRSMSASTTSRQYANALAEERRRARERGLPRRDLRRATPAARRRRSRCRTPSRSTSATPGSLWDRTDPVSFVRDARLARELVVTWSFWIGNYIYDDVLRLPASTAAIDAHVGFDRHDARPRHPPNDTPPGDAYGTRDREEHRRSVPPAFPQLQDRLRRRRREQPGRRAGHDQRRRAAFGNAFDEQRTVLVDRTGPRSQPVDRPAVAGREHDEARTRSASRPDTSSRSPARRRRLATRATRRSSARRSRSTRSGSRAYRDGELYAGGDYPNQGAPGQGLNAYANSENTKGSDVVVWATVGGDPSPDRRGIPRDDDRDDRSVACGRVASSTRTPPGRAASIADASRRSWTSMGRTIPKRICDRASDFETVAVRARSGRPLGNAPGIETRLA